jgi:hypothetical protein
MSEVIIVAAYDNVNAINARGHRAGVPFENATDPIPVAPFRTVPPFVHEIAIVARGEDVEASGSP